VNVDDAWDTHLVFANSSILDARVPFANKYIDIPKIPLFLEGLGIVTGHADVNITKTGFIYRYAGIPYY